MPFVEDATAKRIAVLRTRTRSHGELVQELLDKRSRQILAAFAAEAEGGTDVVGLAFHRSTSK